MFIDENGKGIHRDLRMHSIREPESTKLVKEILKEDDVVLEAGANIGYYTILESKKIGKRGIVYAVEQTKDNFKLLKKNIKLNGLKNVRVFNNAFSDRIGKISININEEGNLNTPLNLKDYERKESVKCMTLDSFFKNKRKPDFMRMDIEGYEDVIFKGGEKTLGSLKKIFVELHFPLLGKKRMFDLLNLLKQKGFEIYKAVMEWERWEDDSNFLGKFVNYLHKKRSKPIVYDNLTISKLINSRNFIGGHLSLEVFFVKKGKIENEGT